jgi:hypothetical protein
MIDLDLGDTSHDIEIQNGDLQLTQDGDQTAQHVKIRLMAFYKEWFLDLRVGTPYFEEILGQKFRPGRQAAVIRKRILETEEVNTILEFDFNRINRVLSVNSDFDTIYNVQKSVRLSV